MWNNKKFDSKADLGILFIRIALAAVFIAHGWSKFAKLEGTVDFFNSLGLAPWLAYLVAFFELVGGIAMLTGFEVHLFAVPLAAIMIAAITLVKFPKGGFLASEYEFTLLMASLSMIFLGSGKYGIGCFCVKWFEESKSNSENPGEDKSRLK